MSVTTAATLLSVGLGALLLCACSAQAPAPAPRGHRAPPPRTEEPPAEPEAHMQAEAGFVDVPAAAVVGPAYPARMFWAFHPADRHPQSAPVVVFFNGGPGAATTGILFAYGTGPATLDPAAAVDATPIANPSSWTRFANLLFLDDRQAGFSYGHDGVPGCAEGDALFVEDAAAFVLATLDFLDAHEPLRNNPVVLVGESYGGTRAPTMLHLLQHYAVDPETAVAGLPDVHAYVPWLEGRVQAHFDAVASQPVPPRTADEVAAQFGAQILIQPNIAGLAQFEYEAPLAAADPDLAALLAQPGAHDDYDVRRTPEDFQRIVDHAARTMRHADGFASLAGLPWTDVPGLAAAERGAAFRFVDGPGTDDLKADEAQIRAALGELAEGDAYWLGLSPSCPAVGGTGALGDLRSAELFLRGLERNATFVTNARYDRVVYTDAFPGFFELAGLDVSVDATAPAGAARPGVIHLVGEAGAWQMRFPTYESGHEVTIGAPAQLADDVEAWLDDSGLLAPE